MMAETGRVQRGSVGFASGMSSSSSTVGAKKAAAAALLVGGAHAALSFYWIAGGQWGLDIVGTDLPERAELGDDMALWIMWVTALMKTCGALVGVVAVWWRRPNWLRTTARWVALVAGGFLILYGFGIALIATAALLGVVEAGPEANRDALFWHAVLWNPWFGVWGVLLVWSSRVERATMPPTKT